MRNNRDDDEPTTTADSDRDSDSNPRAYTMRIESAAKCGKAIASEISAEHERRIAELAAAYDTRRRQAFRSLRGVYSDRGERWPTIADAARALGVQYSSVYRALNTPCRILGRRVAYVGDALPAERSAAVVDDEGRRWSTVTAAAEELGVSDTTVIRYIDAGRPLAGRILSRGPDYGKGQGRWRHTRGKDNGTQKDSGALVRIQKVGRDGGGVAVGVAAGMAG